MKNLPRLYLHAALLFVLVFSLLPLQTIHARTADSSRLLTVGPGTYQENDPNLTLTGNWTTWSASAASGGAIRYSNQPGASATLTFQGRQVSLLFTRFTSRGNVEITIDGGTPVLLNQYGKTLVYQNRWDSPLMDEGIHTIQLRHPDGSHYIDIDALIVSSPETVPPAAVTLSAASGASTGQVNLNWTAPGDDGNTGTAAEYILRYAASAIDSQAVWDAATDVTGEPVPQIAGTPQSMTVSGLNPGQTYHFALRTRDAAGNLSDLSNSPSAEAKTPTPVGTGTWQENDINIAYTGNWTTWSASAASGGAIRYSNQPGASATLTFQGRQVSLLFTRFTSRGNVEITIDGGTPVLLNQYGKTLVYQNRWDSPLMDEGIHTIQLRHPGGSHYIDIDAFIVSSPETVPPAAVTLSAASGASTGQVNLNWIAPGDDGNTGTAAEYILRYAASAIDSQAKWDAATDVTGEPVPQIAGTPQSMTVSGLNPGQTYHFALRTLDAAGNLSDLSNSPSAEAKAPTPVGTGTYQEKDANIVYTGNWTDWTTAPASGGSTRYSNDPAASATLTFFGGQVSLVYTGYSTRGNIEISIDGGAPLLVNQRTSSLKYQNRWDSPPLNTSLHTITLRHPGGTGYIDLDAIIVSPHKPSGNLIKSRVQLTQKPAGEAYQYNWHPAIDGDYFVWQREGSGYQGIDLHRISTGVTTEIASEGDNPQLHGNNVVWECGDVCLYEINTGVTTRIADNDHPGNGSQSPRVYGDYVVFTSDEDGDDEIYLYRISTGVKHKLTNNTSIDSWPDIDENHIVWVNGNFDILLYKISTGATTNISNNQNWNASPSISGDYVVWMGGNPSNIYLYQISTSTITQITNDAASDRVPQINGNHVVWLKYTASGNIKDVYLYAINSSTSKKIASTDTEFTWDLETGPYVKGDFVTWMSRDGSTQNDNEIYLYQISTDTLEMASDNLGGDGHPALSGTHLVWAGSLYPSGNYDIFLAELNSPVGSGIYQETDANIAYTGAWTSWSHANASGGAIRYSNQPGATATLNFQGRQVSLLFTRFTSRGNVEITIDGGTPMLLNQYGASLTFQNRWDSPLMDEGIHTIQLRHPGGSHYIDIDALIVSSPETVPPAAVTLSAATGASTGQVNLNWTAPGDDGNTGTAAEYILRYAASAIDSQAVWDAATDVTGEPVPQIAGTPQSMTVSGLNPGQTYHFALRTLDDSNNLSALSNSPSAQAKDLTAVSPGIYDEAGGQIAFTGTWTAWSASGPYQGSIKYSNQPGAEALLKFTGKQVILIFTRYSTRGNIEISIDGGTPVLLNQYGSSLTWQQRWISPPLSEGTHTIRLRHPGGTHYIDVDAIEVKAEADMYNIPAGCNATLNPNFEIDVLNLLNQERQKAGLGLLTLQPQLDAAANSHSADMACNNFFSHTGSNGSSVRDRTLAQGYTSSYVGENIYAGSGPYNSPQQAVTAWMNSAGHRANILNPNYTHIGIGYVYTSTSTYKAYFTTDFGRP